VESVKLPHQGRERHYWLIKPDRKTGGEARLLPLLVMLHGTGGSGEWAEEEISWSDWLSRSGELIIALPDGLPVDPELPPRFLSNPARWNDGSEPPEVAKSPFPDDVGFLLAVIDDVSRRCWVDPKRIYLSGFSNGGGMCFRLAAEYSTRVAAIAPVAGYCPAALPVPVCSVPTLYLIGTADPLVPLNGGTVQLPWGNRPVTRPPLWPSLGVWANAIGCDSQPRMLGEQNGVATYHFPAVQPSAATFEVVTVHGLGHHWPGGRGRMNPRIAGPWIPAIDARYRIWSFFRQHRRE